MVSFDIYRYAAISKVLLRYRLPGRMQTNLKTDKILEKNMCLGLRLDFNPPQNMF